MPRTDSDYKKGHVFRASAKSLLALVYATIGSASMESGKVMVKGGPGKVTNPDGTESALMLRKSGITRFVFRDMKSSILRSITNWPKRKQPK